MNEKSEYWTGAFELLKYGSEEVLKAIEESMKHVDVANAYVLIDSHCIGDHGAVATESTVDA